MKKRLLVGTIALTALVLAGCMTTGGSSGAVATFEQQTGIPVGTVMQALSSYDGSDGNFLVNLMLNRQAGLRYDPTFNGPGYIDSQGKEMEFVFGPLPQGLNGGNNWVYATGVLAALDAVIYDPSSAVETGFHVMDAILSDPQNKSIALPASVEKGIDALKSGPISFKGYAGRTFSVLVKEQKILYK